MLMDQQNIIRKQRETIEKKKHQLTKLKQKHTKTTEELKKKQIKMYIYTANIDLYLFFICF